tara:strand:+ start:1156 stop:1389 length:234 start_codon:yes stop_codon:yes gene_type:complete
MNTENLNELVDRLLTIENEMNILREDKKTLLTEFKEKLDVKSVQAAMRIAKIKARLSDTSDETLDEMVSNIEKKITV